MLKLILTVRRKERMEAEMKQLEKDIETIEKHKVIYVTDNF